MRSCYLTHQEVENLLRQLVEFGFPGFRPGRMVHSLTVSQKPPGQGRVDLGKKASGEIRLEGHWTLYDGPARLRSLGLTHLYLLGLSRHRMVAWTGPELSQFAAAMMFRIAFPGHGIRDGGQISWVPPCGLAPVAES